jgi:hypothetical protein
MTQNANRTRREMNDPWWVRSIVIFLSIGFVALMLVLPLGVIFFEAFRKGAKLYFAAFQDRNSIRAITMGLKVMPKALDEEAQMKFIDKFGFPTLHLMNDFGILIEAESDESVAETVAAVALASEVPELE